MLKVLKLGVMEISTVTYVTENDRWWLDLMASRKTKREPGLTRKDYKLVFEPIQ